MTLEYQECPVCNAKLPKDATFCPYCGLGSDDRGIPDLPMIEELDMFSGLEQKIDDKTVELAGIKYRYKMERLEDDLEAQEVARAMITEKTLVESMIETSPFEYLAYVFIGVGILILFQILLSGAFP